MTLNLKSEPVEIAGTTYETTQFPAMRAYGLLTRLVKAIGPALGVLASADKETQLADMGPVLGAALANVSPSEAQGILVEALAATTAVFKGENGAMKLVELTSTAKIDEVFSGKLKTMFQVLVHALKVNYGDFSEGSDPAAPTDQASSG